MHVYMCVFVYGRPPKTVCRQCPENVGLVGKAKTTMERVMAKVVGLVTGEILLVIHHHDSSRCDAAASA